MEAPSSARRATDRPPCLWIGTDHGVSARGSRSRCDPCPDRSDGRRLLRLLGIGDARTRCNQGRGSDPRNAEHQPEDSEPRLLRGVSRRPDRGSRDGGAAACTGPDCRCRLVLPRGGNVPPGRLCADHGPECADEQCARRGNRPRRRERGGETLVRLFGSLDPMEYGPRRLQHDQPPACWYRFLRMGTPGTSIATLRQGGPHSMVPRADAAAGGSVC
jgi:hypothetical protein